MTLFLFPCAVIFSNIGRGGKQGHRRPKRPPVRSLDHFVFTVPALDEAARFYADFGLDMRRVDGRLDLQTFGHAHRWGSIHRAPGRKKLQYLSLYAFDFVAIMLLRRFRTEELV